MIHIDKSDLHEKCMVPQKVIRPGDELFVFCASGRNYRKSFYVRAVVEDVTYIWSNYKGESPGIWHSCSLEAGDQLTTSTGERNQQGWDIYREILPDEFEKLREENGLKVVNQMPWVDWPIGHAAYIDDDAFFSIEEARERYGRFSGRKLGRRMRSSLRRVMSFVSSTWKMNGEDGPTWDSVESMMRKGYV